jgi:ethanolamine ammonia-lyase small subunit
MSTRDASPAQDDWAQLRSMTQARIGLGSVGYALPVRHALAFQADHAAARDAVHQPLDVDSLSRGLAELCIGTPTIVQSRAGSRAEYLRRPDLGRTPKDLSSIVGSTADIGIVLADGLSPRALMDHGRGLTKALVDRLEDRYRIAPPVIATSARVALGDHIGQALNVTTVLVIIGERPGLSVANSLGIYLTHLPHPGCTDADRNCVSNIHTPHGLSYEHAAEVTARLVSGARKLGRSGVALKDRSDTALEPRHPGAVTPSAVTPGPTVDGSAPPRGCDERDAAIDPAGP